MLLLALAVGGCGGPVEVPVPAEMGDVVPGDVAPAERAALFRRLCASCHGPEAQGDGPVATELRVPPTDLTRLAARQGGVFPRADVADVLTGRRPVAAHGPPEMPVWAQRLGRVGSPAPAAAALHQARLLGALLDHLEAAQRRD